MFPSRCLRLFILISVAYAAHTAYRYGDKSRELTAADGRIRGIRDSADKDFVLGGLFAVHKEDDDIGGLCGGVRAHDQSVEAMLFAIDSVNANETLLPNITLGFDIRDTCYSENVGLDEAIDVIISGNQLDIGSCDCGSTNLGGNTSEMATPTVGIIGAAASRVSIPVASLGRLFQVPQVSFASTSPILSNRETYTYFFRTVPPDNLQAQALIDLILYFNWTQISLVYIGDSYGQLGAVMLRNLAATNNICIDLDREIGGNFIKEDYQMLAETLLESEANVVVLFAHQHNARLLLEAVVNSSSGRKFTWIASDGWAHTLALAHLFNETIAGYYGVAPLAPHVPAFESYLSNITIETNRRNHWFDEIYSGFAFCSLLKNSSRACNTRRNLTSLTTYTQHNFVPATVDAVYAYANALHDYLVDNCYHPSEWNRVTQSCPGQRLELKGSVLLHYLSRVDFVNPLTGNRVTFDNLGNAAGRYEILNFQAQISNGLIEYGLQQVGKWSSFNGSESEPLELFEHVTLQFGLNSSRGIIYQPLITRCGRCSPGEFRRPVASSCCGVCDPCRGRSFSDDPTASSCKNCSRYMWGNSPIEGSSYCVPIPETFLRFDHPWSIVNVILTIFGLVGTAIAAVVFVVHWNTPVVKSSGREQMVILLIGIAISFILPFIYLSPPVLGICVIQSVGVWLALSLMFGALLVKIVRVARIFLSKSTLTHLRFTEPYYQIFFTLVIVLGQMVIIAAAIAYQVPHVQREIQINPENSNSLPESLITCAVYPLGFVIVSIVYESAIIMSSTILGVLSFKYPANFNEAKYVSFCTFAVLVIWVVFIITHLVLTQSMKEFQNAIISLGIIMTAFSVLLTIFGRKVLIVVFFREKNVNFALQCVHSQANSLSRGKALSLMSLRCVGATQCNGMKEIGKGRVNIINGLKVPSRYNDIAAVTLS